MILDSTLRDALRLDTFNPSFEEKLSIAQLLNDSGVNTIECGYSIADKEDLLIAKELSQSDITASISVLSYCDINNIKKAYEAIKEAKNPHLNIYISLGELVPSYQQQSSHDDILNHVINTIYEASELCDNIQFTAMDATRSDVELLLKVFKQVQKYGASTLGIADTFGVATPRSLSMLINALTSNLDLEDTNLSLHAHNDLSLADTNAKLALTCNVHQIEGTIAGVGERLGNVNSTEMMRHFKMDIPSKLLELEKEFKTSYAST